MTTPPAERDAGVRRPPRWYWVTVAALFVLVLAGIWFFSNGLARLEHGRNGLLSLSLGAGLVVVPNLAIRVLARRLGVRRWARSRAEHLPRP